MKVLYFHQHFCTPSGANGIRSYAMSEYLIKRGHSVTMVCGSYVSADTGLRTEFRNGIRRGMVDGIDVIEMDVNEAFEAMQSGKLKDGKSIIALQNFKMKNIH